MSDAAREMMTLVETLTVNIQAYREIANVRMMVVASLMVAGIAVVIVKAWYKAYR